MSDVAVEAARWEFVVWSEEGQGRYSVCLHRGDLGSPDHLCLGEAVSKASAEHAVHHANEWLTAHTADLTARLASAEGEANEMAGIAETWRKKYEQAERDMKALEAAVEQAMATHLQAEVEESERVKGLLTRLAEAEVQRDNWRNDFRDACHQREATENERDTLRTRLAEAERERDEAIADMGIARIAKASAEQRGRHVEAALADMIDVADRCAWYVVRATNTTPYEARIRAARTALTLGDKS